MENLIIHSKEIFPFLEIKLSNTKNQLIIVSAFVKIDALERIDQCINADIEKILLLRFRKMDLISKATDVELFEYCKNNGWKMYFNLDLHSKIFVFDKQRFFIGSANVTLSGLGISDKSNIESGVSGPLEQDDYSRLLSFFEISELMTDRIMNAFKNQIPATSNSEATPEWNLNGLNIFKVGSPKKLWVSEFLSSASSFDVKSSDLKLLGLTRPESYDEDILKKSFMNLKCYKWLLDSFEDEIYFGELSSKLHNSLIDDPRPYRKDVKDLLTTLLNWITELKIDDIIIDRPNYSQRIRKTSIERASNIDF
ncbi:phospholipase D-like domain-containing protein [Lysinibacillus antri]|uniref:PLD phosphodiesterase domain-containing protein n=1 Tax=Lysinibacillus antri TaxID=2498145 RepID=A0A3S0R405_9BACI|nr:phospholipase D-like domain-containing protein [Lysinibacillus antri]RUL46532.1 hypothetical protein EK386_18970 [Lysinibacillus antri]